VTPSRISFGREVAVGCGPTQTTALAVLLVDFGRIAPQLPRCLARGPTRPGPAETVFYSRYSRLSTQSSVTDAYRAFPVNTRSIGRMIFAPLRTSRRPWRQWTQQTRTRRRIFGVVSRLEGLQQVPHANMLFEAGRTVKRQC
jgi:hypothetical protein